MTRKELGYSIPCFAWIVTFSVLFGGCGEQTRLEVVSRGTVEQASMFDQFEWHAILDRPEGSWAWAVAFGDVDGDGDLDLAHGDEGYPVLLYENIGTDLHSTAIWKSEERLKARGLAFGDIDADGDLDLAVGIEDGADTLHENAGTMLNQRATWTAADPVPTFDVALGDVDGDGDIDLVTANNNVSASVYDNAGTALSSNPIWEVSAQGDGYAVALGDVDSDGDIDLASGQYGSENSLYANNGTGLGAAAVWASTETAQTLSLAFGDINGDGELDLCTGNYLAENHLHLNIGGLLNPVAVWNSLGTRGTRDLVLGDLDGDGDLDLVSIDGDDGLLVTENARGTIGVEDGMTSGSSISLAVADRDGDGDLDLTLGGAWTTGGPRLLTNTYTPIFSHDSWSLAESNDTRGLTFGDVDGDGDLDLAVGNAQQSNRVHYNVGGVLESSASWASTETDGTQALSFGDVNGDGDLDLAVANAGTVNRLYENTGSQLSATASWSSTETAASYSLAFGDVDADGDLDLAVGNDSEANQLYENASGTLAVTAVWMSAEVNSTRSIAFGDIDGDADIDIASGNDGQSNHTFRNVNGVLQPSSTWSTYATLPTRSVGFGDVDGDGDFDLLVGNFGQGTMLYGNTGANLARSPQWASNTADASEEIAMGDVDGDGDLDLVVGNLGQSNRLYRNAGAQLQSISGWSSFDLDDTVGVTLGDIAGAGNPELAVANRAQPNRLYTLGRLTSFGLPRASMSGQGVLGRMGVLDGTAAAPGRHAGIILTSGPLTIPFTLFHAHSATVGRVELEFSYGGTQWRNGTLLGATGPFISSPAGVEHSVSWDIDADQVFHESVTVRLRLSDERRPVLPHEWQKTFAYLVSTPVRIKTAAGPDGDGDGVPALLDCDDSNASVYPGAFEDSDSTCNDGADNDCDGAIDCSDGGCLVSVCLGCIDDLDMDGYRTCGTTPDCNDTIAAINPGSPDVICDGLDNDCDGLTDDDYVREGPCGNGACRTFSVYSSCVQGAVVPCSPGSPPESPEVSCVDSIDNDCDRLVDTMDWDCECLDLDADGYDTCDLSHALDSDGLAADCDDSKGEVNPGNTENKTPICGDNIDNDCDGIVDCADADCPPQACGACTIDADSDGVRACGGGLTDCDDTDPTIYPGAPEVSCNGVDNDCDSEIDEGYVSDKSCLLVPCSFESTCVGGAETPCTVVPPSAATDMTCDGVDDDCDGTFDEEYVANRSCGTGACFEANIASACNSGTEEVCVEGAPLGPVDDTCDAIDDDCDGVTDDNFVADSSCGVGFCKIANTPSSCTNGVVIPCVPGSPQQEPERDCFDSVDNDCDGYTDGADADCAVACTDNDGDGYGNPGSALCTNGAAMDCDDADRYRHPNADESVCNGVDDDCDGPADEDYFPVSACGVGHCRQDAVASMCASGIETQCEPAQPLAMTDVTCDGIDDDCDGTPDDDYVIDSECNLVGCESVITPSACAVGVETQCQALCREDARIEHSANPHAVVGVPYLYDGDKRVDVSQGTSSGLSLVVVLAAPSGLIAHPTTYEVGWTPTVAGTASVSLGLLAADSSLVDRYDFAVEVEHRATVPAVASAVVTPRRGPSPLTVVLDGSASRGTDDREILEYMWATSDGSGLRSNTPIHGFTFSRPGGYSVRLDLRDALGFTASHKVEVSVLDGDLVPPRARIAASALTGEGFAIIDFSCDCAGADGTELTYFWSFGDGTTSSIPAPVHTFDSPGSFVVRLVVEDEQGLTARDSEIVAVTSNGLRPPTVQIQADSIDDDGPLAVQFHARAYDTDGVVESVVWTLPDGNSSTGNDVVVQMLEAGYYAVAATVTDNDGLQGHDETTVTIRRDGARPIRIVSAPDVSAKVGVSYAYDLDGLPSAQGDRPFVWLLGRAVGGIVSNVPIGMSIDEGTGRLTWTPKVDDVGQHRVTLRATNGISSDWQDFVIAVVEADGAAVDAGSSAAGGCACDTHGGRDASLFPLSLILVFLGTGSRRRRPF